MDGTSPLELSRLLGSPDIANREAAWEKLIAGNTRLLLAVARSFGGDHDDAMERYSFIIEKLREADFRRLRAFDPGCGASFSTWLTVAARNFCLDLHRSRFGRQRSELPSDKSTALRAARRALSDLTEGDIPLETIPDSSGAEVDSRALRGELDECLRRALSHLTPTERLILTMRFEDNMPASQIAGILGFRTQFHVYRQLNAVLKRLRTELRQSGIDSSQG